MGVPSFYRWLVGKYPKTVVSAIDEGEGCDSQQPNPNGEFDNLYLDMNGIIHPCFHPDNEIFPPTTFDEVFVAVFNYIDRLFRIVRPRKLLFVALDGVAPRAKMNQQRMRRYRTAEDAEIAEIEEERLRKEFAREGKKLLPKQENSEVSDSNVITPGTVFMRKLSIALEYYIRLRLNNEPSWNSIVVILSDSNNPGEGEHKIMSFVRSQRKLFGYDPNTRHCIHGLDADLIMLTLATHELHFSVLREDVLKSDQQVSSFSTFVGNSSQKELDMMKSRDWFKKFETGVFKKVEKEPFQFLNIWTLREYLELDMKPQPNADIERIVDDFIFICYFAGNDFLPRIPSLEIHENGIDLLIAVYKKSFKQTGDYLINASNLNKENGAYLNFKTVKFFITEVGFYEENIFEKRFTLRQRMLKRLLLEKEKDEKDAIDHWNPNFNSVQENFECRNISSSFSTKCDISCHENVEPDSSAYSDSLENTKELKRKLKVLLRDKNDLFKNDFIDKDKVKLGFSGWRSRYYKEKLSVENPKDIDATRKDLVKNYVEGLCWILHYYFNGICSWSWYYPYYYPPFASDFKDLCYSKITFTLGNPFKPFDQLMSVLHPRSSHALPEAYRNLMNNDISPIADFYPKDFAVDNDGKRFAWQGIIKLPFLNEEAVLRETKVLLKGLKADEVERNGIIDNKVFVMDSNPLLHINEAQNYDIIFKGCCGLNGFLSDFELSKFTSISEMENDKSRCATFIIDETKTHIPRLLEHVIIPEKTITEADIVERTLWHEYHGHHPPPQPMPPREMQRQQSAPANVAWRGAGEGWSGGSGRGKVLSDPTFYGPFNTRGASYEVASSHSNRTVDQCAVDGSVWRGARQGTMHSHRTEDQHAVDCSVRGGTRQGTMMHSNRTVDQHAVDGSVRGGTRQGMMFSGGPHARPGNVRGPPYRGPSSHPNRRFDEGFSDFGRGRYSPAPSFPPSTLHGREMGRAAPSSSGRGDGGGNQNFKWVVRDDEQSYASMGSDSGFVPRFPLNNDGGRGRGRGRGW